ncbi:unnamed protein product [Medioppia subpectinata]|uniref:oleoyl-[acyl-carrier-protein] hydrolase n=1 Tax=Medioppia subpectinata TaxID=1979941 RepID=A0A7R9KTI1_9ACAR|nr:unnamed protein product [Medioppia subpectinata]CAG2108345.1 unnamed protein product [Medioppia subpectinata]
MAAAKKVGFRVIGSKTDGIGSMAVLFRRIVTKLTNIPLEKNVIEINDKNNEWFDSIKERLLIKREDEKNDEHIWLLASDSSLNGVLGLLNCLRLEPGGDSLRCIFDCDKRIKMPLDFNESPFYDILTNDLVVNVLKDGHNGSFRHYSLPRDYDKVQTSDYFLNIGQNRDLSSLQWFDSKNLVPKATYYDINNRKCKQIRCNIYSSGLNFRDVMLATGRIVSGPQSLFTDCLLGFEFAGRRTDDGKRVCGFDLSRCFATFVDSIEEFISPIPDHWSMDDAVTILSTYSTVWYGLIERAKLQKFESILIHSGAGGVGQASITVCQYYKCDIYVTVGTEDKKQFLMKEYNIPENRIFSSRDTQFKFRIKALTKGKGVDLVLNSLAGDKLEASYECVADCGRFVEIGKYDLQMNKQLGMFSFLRDISFIGVSVDRKLFLVPGFAKQFFDWMHENSNNGMIKPINRTVFKASEAEKAFRYMTTGKHMGKIVVKMREEENSEMALKGYNPSQKLTATTKTYFDPHKVYVITGGLGGFGLELLHWMIFLGARNFVLTSRFGVRNKYQKFILDRIKSLGKKFEMFKPNIVVSTQDTNTWEGTKAMFAEAEQLGAIGGVFHLALVLNDCLIENQTYDKFEETVDSKVKSFQNFDKLSRESALSLDYFVVFSSVSCGKGNAGQVNYGFANSICERICEQRRKDGLHGLAIQWGPIGDVGVLSTTEINASLSGIVKQRINSCLDVLDKFLQTPHSVVSCVVRAERSTMSGTKEARIVSQIWLALGIDPKTTPDHLTLGEIGMESMFAVELQQGLERDYDIKVSLNDIKSVTVKLMKDFEAGKVEELRAFSEEIKNCRSKLSKIKFIIPTDVTTRLNSVKTGVPVYFLPPLEGIFASLEGLADKIDRPAIGLNWTRDMEKLGSLKEIAKYYTDLLKQLHPKGGYDIVGHFYGALIAMKMLKKAPIGKAVIIDMLSEIKMDEEMLSDDYLLELIAKFISKDLPKPLKDKISRDMNGKHDVSGKLAKLSDEVKDFVGKSLVSKDLEEILMNSFTRAKLFTSYRLNMKNKFKQIKLNVGRKYLEMKGKVLIIKPFDYVEDEVTDMNAISDRIRDSYFLPEKGLEGKLNFEKIEANGDDMSNQTFDRIADSINHDYNKTIEIDVQYYYKPDVVDSRIGFGADIEYGEAPWAVFLEFHNFVGFTKGSCSGVLVTRLWVLTAAHCFLGRKHYRLLVKGGRDPDKPIEKRYKDVVIIHLLIFRLFLLNILNRNQSEHSGKGAAVVLSEIEYL